MENFDEYFAILGISSNATEEQIRKAFKRQIIIHHPDKGGDTEITKKINIAKDKCLERLGRRTRNVPEPGIQYQTIYKTSMLEEIAEFPTKTFHNNFKEFYEQLLKDGITQIQQDTAGVNFFCLNCKKHFANELHHFHRIMRPYVDMIIGKTPSLVLAHRDLIRLLKQGFGDAWDFKIEIPIDMEFWQDKRWENILKDCSNIKGYTKVDNYIHQDLGKQVPLVSAKFMYEPPSPVDLTAIKLEQDRDDFDNILGLKVKVDISKLGVALDRKFVPSYIIRNPPKKDTQRVCTICNLKILPIPKQLLNCKVCGKSMCRNCVKKKPILHMGFNQPKNICPPCELICQEEDSTIWAKEALHCLECSDLNAARLCLYISEQYFKGMEKIPNTILTLYKNVATAAMEGQDFQTVLICQMYQRIEGLSSWGYVAYQLAQEGETAFPFALSCLENASSSLNSSNKEYQWDILGDRFGNYHPQLAMYCYRQCKFDYLEWIGKKASFYKTKSYKEGSRNCHVLIFLCLSQAFNLIQKSGKSFQAREIIEKLFISKEYRLALYSLKTADVNIQDIIFLTNGILKTKDEIDTTAIMLIIDYVLNFFPIKSVSTFKQSSDFVRSIIESQQSLDVDREKDFFDLVNKTTNVISLIPLICSIGNLGSFESWELYSQNAIQKNNFHAACIFLKLESLSVERFDGTKWKRLGTQLIEKKVKNLSLICFLLAEAAGEKYAMSDIDDHEVFIQFCLKTTNLTLLRERGRQLLEKSDENNGFKYYVAIFQSILKADVLGADEKLETLLEFVQEVFSSRKPKSFLIKVKKCIMAKYPEGFFNASTFPIHQEILKPFLDHPDYEGLEMIQAALHFLPKNTFLTDEAFIKFQSKCFEEHMTTCFYNQDFTTLKKILLQLNTHTIPDAQAFLLQYLGSRDIDAFPPPHKAVILLLQATLEKVKGNWVNALNFLEEAMDSSLKNLLDISSIVAAIFVDDFHFHEQIYREFEKEMIDLKMRVKDNKLDGFKGLPLLLPDCVPKASKDYIMQFFEVISEEDSMKMLEFEKFVEPMSHRAAGFSYIDFSYTLDDQIVQVASLMMASCNFLMELETTTDAAEAYGLRNLIHKLCTKIQCRTEGGQTPNFEIFVNRMLLSLLLRSNYYLSENINQAKKTKFSSGVKEDVIPVNMRDLIFNLLMNTIKLLKVCPLTGGGSCSGLTALYKHIMRLGFLKCYYNQKCKEDFHPHNFPRYLYSFHRAYGVLQQWIDSMSLEEAFEEASKDFQEAMKGQSGTFKYDEHGYSLYQGYLKRWGQKKDKVFKDKAEEPEDQMTRIASSLTLAGTRILLLIVSRTSGNSFFDDDD